MAINFPNQSRHYEAAQRAVRFWGHDQSMESNFLVTVEALKRIQPSLRLEAAEILRAFDVNRDRIYGMATRAYARGRKSSYRLNVDDV